MLENIWLIAAVWTALALLASLISIRAGISVALVEILVGVLAGNIAVGLEGGTLHIGIAGAGASTGHLHHVLQSTEWTNFLALLGSGCSPFSREQKSIPFRLRRIGVRVCSSVFFRSPYHSLSSGPLLNWFSVGLCTRRKSRA